MPSRVPLTLALRRKAGDVAVVPALPTGPICNPGHASIMAATSPAPRDRSLYFVADGQGGHVFAANVYEHNRNVARWKEIVKQRQEQGLPASPPPATAPTAPKP